MQAAENYGMIADELQKLLHKNLHPNMKDAILNHLEFHHIQTAIAQLPAHEIGHVLTGLMGIYPYQSRLYSEVHAIFIQIFFEPDRFSGEVARHGGPFVEHEQFWQDMAADRITRDAFIDQFMPVYDDLIEQIYEGWARNKMRDAVLEIAVLGNVLSQAELNEAKELDRNGNIIALDQLYSDIRMDMHSKLEPHGCPLLIPNAKGGPPKQIPLDPTVYDNYHLLRGWVLQRDAERAAHLPDDISFQAFSPSAEVKQAFLSDVFSMLGHVAHYMQEHGLDFENPYAYLDIPLIEFVAQENTRIQQVFNEMGAGY
ncbi:hypothetical protein GC177_01855 [bacterium]|nr:hypothetical protein [bacterium]